MRFEAPPFGDLSPVSVRGLMSAYAPERVERGIPVFREPENWPANYKTDFNVLKKVL